MIILYFMLKITSWEDTLHELKYGSKFWLIINHLIDKSLVLKHCPVELEKPMDPTSKTPGDISPTLALIFKGTILSALVMPIFAISVTELASRAVTKFLSPLTYIFFNKSFLLHLQIQNFNVETSMPYPLS